MQGFNRYYPPDYDPEKHHTLNAVHGKHALVDRARKIDKGILITRFELPFNIWCGGCNAHIGQGVRFNAEKKKVGNYYSTPIYSFRCKCHVCAKNWFEIQTDPKNTRYVVTSGARQKNEEWDPAEAGAFVLDQKDKDFPVDPLASVEKATNDKANALSAAERLEEIKTLNEDRWSDPYELSRKLRNTFRADKKERKIRDDTDATLKSRLGLSSTLQLDDDTPEEREKAKRIWLKEQAKIEGVKAEDRRKRRRIEVELGEGVGGLQDGPSSSSVRQGIILPSTGNLGQRSASASKRARIADSKTSSKTTSTNAADLLKSRLLLKARYDRDPFLATSSVPKMDTLIGIRSKGLA